MKKVRIVVIAVSIALMVMGVGYAAWSQLIPIQVTGSLSQMDVNVSNAWVDGASDPFITTKLTGSKALKPWSSFKVSIDNLYPTAQSVFCATIHNNSTMPVILDKITLDSRTGNPNNTLVYITGYSADWTLLNDSASINCGTTLAPNEYKDIKFYVKLDGKADNNTQNQTFGFTITPNFVSNK